MSVSPIPNADFPLGALASGFQDGAAPTSPAGDSGSIFSNVSVPDLAPLDWVGVGLVVILVVLGLWRGLWWQVIRLLGVVAAVAAARILSPEGAEWIHEQWELDPRFANGAAWLGIFLLALGAATLLGVFGQRLLEAMQLGFVNRLGGGVAGAATGLLLHVVGLVVVCQLSSEAFVERYVSGTYSERLVEAASSRWRVVLGAEAAGEVDRLLEGAGRHLPLVEETGSEGSGGERVR